MLVAASINGNLAWQALASSRVVCQNTIDMSESLCLKTIYDLRVDASDDPLRYYNPAYQRGYRWTPTQVTQLLDDMREFTKRENPRPEESLPAAARAAPER
jgi:hypothetical protein